MGVCIKRGIQNGWFIIEGPNLKWMIWGYPYFRKPPSVLSKKWKVRGSYIHHYMFPSWGHYLQKLQVLISYDRKLRNGLPGLQLTPFILTCSQRWYVRQISTCPVFWHRFFGVARYTSYRTWEAPCDQNCLVFTHFHPYESDRHLDQSPPLDVWKAINIWCINIDPYSIYRMKICNTHMNISICKWVNMGQYIWVWVNIPTRNNMQIDIRMRSRHRMVTSPSTSGFPSSQTTVAGCVMQGGPLT